MESYHIYAFCSTSFVQCYICNSQQYSSNSCSWFTLIVLQNEPQYMYPVHLVIDGHKVISDYWKLWILLLWIFNCMPCSEHAFILVDYIPRNGKAGLLYVHICSFSRYCKMYFNLVVPFCISICGIWEF